MRSFFSTLLLLNWGLLLFLLLLAVGIAFLLEFINPVFHYIIQFAYVLVAIYGTFEVSTHIARKVIDPLSLLEKKSKEINAGDFGSELSYPDIQELANLTISINEMASRLKNQFLDLTVEKEKFDSLLQNLKEGVFAIDQSRKFLFLNRNIPFTLIRKDSQFRNFYESVTNTKLRDFLKEKLDSNSEGKIEFEEGVHFYSVRFYPVKTNEIVYLFVGVISEVTEDRQYQLIREQFFQNASHELKTPITSIKGYTETLDYKLKVPSNSPERKFLDAILRNTDRMIRIVDDMLTVTKLEHHETIIQKEVFRIRELVKSIAESVDVLLSQKNQSLFIDIPENLEMEADLVLMEHVLVNLISNASAYSPEKSQITVRCNFYPNINRIQILDQGVGVSPEDQERIFERFFRVDSDRSRKVGGTGLGLSIVKHIALLHKGEVNVRPNPGGGSIFTFEFPKNLS